MGFGAISAIRSLNMATIVVGISLTFPLQILLTYVYCKLTKRIFTLRTSNVFDICIFLTVVVWFYKMYHYENDHWGTKSTDRGFKYWDKPHGFHFICDNILYELKSGEFYFDFLIGATAFFYWIRLMMMLMLTITFGPMINIMINMTKDLLVFLALFIVQIIAFTCIGILLFGKLKEFSNLYNVGLLIFDFSMGNWDLMIFKPLGDKAWVGESFTVVLLIINGIMLLNLIIAIMANTYEDLKKNSFGLYYDGVIEAMPVFKNDRRYGALIATVPPFNLLVVFFMPFFIGCQDEKLLEYVNDFL
jgi:hypothetical protein